MGHHCRFPGTVLFYFEIPGFIKRGYKGKDEIKIHSTLKINFNFIILNNMSNDSLVLQETNPM